MNEIANTTVAYVEAPVREFQALEDLVSTVYEEVASPPE